MNFTKELINNSNPNKYRTCVEFINNHRKITENNNIIPQINNIFECTQINESKEITSICGGF